MHIQVVHGLLTVILLVLMACSQAPAKVIIHPVMKPSAQTTSSGVPANINPPPTLISPILKVAAETSNSLNSTMNHPTNIIVQPSDTVLKLAREYNISLNDLIGINQLKKPYILKVGSDLKLPPYRYHMVTTGDTLHSVARKYQLNVAELKKINDFSDNQNLILGNRIRLFTENNSDLAQATSPIHNTATQSVDVATDPRGVIVEESLTQTTESAATTLPPTPLLRDQESEEDVQLKANASSVIMANSMTKASGAPSPLLRPKHTPTSFTPVASAKGFAWPVSGKVLSEFGPKEGGLYNDGINISAPKGSTVRAAANGTVVYAGNELRGYGNLLLIKHTDGYMTAYAHNDKILVKKGDQVHIGDIIAHVGNTGNVDSPQLHFSLRKGRKALNPEKFLPRIS